MATPNQQNAQLINQLQNATPQQILGLFRQNPGLQTQLLDRAQKNQFPTQISNKIMDAYRMLGAGAGAQATPSPQMPNASATSNLVDQIIIHPQFVRLLQSTSIVPPLMATKIAEFDTKLKKIDYHLNSATTSAEQRAQLAAERARTEKELANVKKGIMSQLMKSEEGKKVIENIKQQVIQAAKAANLNSSNQPRPPAAGAVPGPASRPQQANPSGSSAPTQQNNTSQVQSNQGTTNQPAPALQKPQISPQEALAAGEGRKRKASEVEGLPPPKTFLLGNGPTSQETLYGAGDVNPSSLQPTYSGLRPQFPSNNPNATTNNPFPSAAHPFSDEPPPRPTLTGGMATYRAIAVPQVIRKPIGGEGFKSKSGSRFDEALRSRAGGERERVGGDIKGDAGRAIKRNKLDELLNEIAPGTKLSDEVAEFVYDYIDEWIESVTRGACLLAKHRHSDRLEVRDLQLYLDKTWNIKIPGFGSDEIKPLQGSAGRKVNLPPGYVGRLAAVKEALKGKEKAK